MPCTPTARGDTAICQLPIFPSVPEYWRLTPGERLPSVGERNGSPESFHVSWRWGASPNARQIRLTAARHVRASRSFQDGREQRPAQRVGREDVEPAVLHEQRHSDHRVDQRLNGSRDRLSPDAPTWLRDGFRGRCAWKLEGVGALLAGEAQDAGERV